MSAQLLLNQSQAGEITRLLSATRGGDRDALDRLLSLVYPALRAVAAHLLKSERPGHTLVPTALVNEAVMKLFLRRERAPRDRRHLLASSGRTMRHVLIDHARTRLAQRRGNGETPLPIGAWQKQQQRDLEGLLLLDDLLGQLRRADERAAEVVELRFFAGLTQEEAAEELGVDPRTVQRDWRFARAWLYQALQSHRR